MANGHGNNSCDRGGKIESRNVGNLTGRKWQDWTAYVSLALAIILTTRLKSPWSLKRRLKQTKRRRKKKNIFKKRSWRPHTIPTTHVTVWRSTGRKRVELISTGLQELFWEDLCPADKYLKTAHWLTASTQDPNNTPLLHNTVSKRDWVCNAQNYTWQ